MNHSTLAIAALTLLAGLGCRSEEGPTPTFAVTEATESDALTFNVSGMR